MKKADLHLHTIYSDGSDSLETLLKVLQNEGISVFSVTDHDAIGGSVLMDALCPPDMEFYRGVEFSCITDGVKSHILGYDYDPHSPELKALLAEGEALRHAKLETRLEHLRTVHGIEFSPERIAELRTISSVGKPHLAREIIRLGRAESVDEAIRRYLRGKGTDGGRVDGRKVIQTIQSAGGVAVWAHPLGGERKRHITKEVFLTRLEVLLSAGLQGLECWYSRYDQDEINLLTQTAKDYGLFISGGSDYHGAHKSVRPGEVNCFGQTVYDENLSLLAHLRGRKISSLTQ